MLIRLVDGKKMLHSSTAILSRRILVVDDLRENCAITSEVLQSAGYIVECAYGGMEALAKIERSTYDLVLLDIEMPDLDGYETASAMLCAERGAIRLAALTVDASAARRRRSEEVGLQAHIAKPITSDALLAAIDKLWDLVPEKQSDPWHRENYKDLVRRLGLDRVSSYLALFLERLRGLLDPLDQDPPSFHRLVHDLVSISGMMGFATLSRCCIDYMAIRGAAGEQSACQALLEAGRQAEARLSEHLTCHAKLN